MYKKNLIELNLFDKEDTFLKMKKIIDILKRNDACNVI